MAKYSKALVRPSLQLLNAVGGGVVLDCLDEDEIANIVIDNIYGIIQGDELGVKIEDESEEYEDLDFDGNEADKLNRFSDGNEYIAIGQKVQVLVKESGEKKTILVNYFQNSTKIPPLAKSLIGCQIG